MKIEPIKAQFATTRPEQPAPAKPAKVSHPASPKPEPLAEDQVSVNRTVPQKYVSVEVDPVTQEIVAKLVDENTGKIIQQVPSEAMLNMARSIDEELAKEDRHKP
jgi:uncharacterized FlaG/YvyC family protein